MYKLIAIDLDGTLFDSYGKVSNKNREAIKYAINKGIEVVLTSGREPQSVKQTSLNLGIQNYLIAGNGASIYSIEENKSIFASYLEKNKVLDIIQMCKKNSIFVNIYTNRGIITERLEYNVKVFNSENNYKTIQKRTSIEIVKNIYEYINEHELEILKIIICDDNKIVFNNIIKKIKKISGINVLDIEHMSKKRIKAGTQEINVEYFYTEITKEKTDKWNALKFLIEKLQIKPEEVICVGDNLNDRQMIENAGLGISMENSALAVLKIGDYITSDNNSDGVAKAIYKFLR